MFHMPTPQNVMPVAGIIPSTLLPIPVSGNTNLNGTQSSLRKNFET